jgi:hypothetical protein
VFDFEKHDQPSEKQLKQSMIVNFHLFWLHVYGIFWIPTEIRTCPNHRPMSLARELH